MKSKHLIAILASIFAIIACSNKYSPIIDKTVFIPDASDSKLPAYTELGYNSFGAKYERNYFLSSTDIIPCKIKYDNNAILFALNGIIKNRYSKMSLYFSFPFEKCASYEDLIKLHNTKISLTNTNFVKLLENDSIEKTLKILEGELYFKRVQNLIIDEAKCYVILSGTFDFKFDNGTEFPSIIQNGRFDLAINNSYFTAK